MDTGGPDGVVKERGFVTCYGSDELRNQIDERAKHVSGLILHITVTISQTDNGVWIGILLLVCARLVKSKWYLARYQPLFGSSLYGYTSQ